VLEFGKLISFAKENAVDVTVVGPDDPLALGICDAFAEEGLRCFGPVSGAARLESSKAFSKSLMRKYHIPTAAYEIFDDVNKALAYVDTLEPPIVLKADGLALGKGVLICETRELAREGLVGMMSGGKFGSAGSTVVIEEFMTGPEVTVLAFCDGKTVKPMVSSQDHKRALDGDRGLNTGGMGAVSPSRFYTSEVARVCEDTIFKPTVAALAAEGIVFKGIIYFGLMITPDGPRVVEYNARFGDPEAQVVLPRLKTDLLDIVNAVIDGKLEDIELEFADEACACVVMASGGYPESYEKGLEIKGEEEAASRESVTVFYAGVAERDGKLVTNGGRVLGVCAVGSDVAAALRSAYGAVEVIDFQGKHFRRDIGAK
jgi:phosphoribosylamine--glycine ligase